MNEWIILFKHGRSTYQDLSNRWSSHFLVNLCVFRLFRSKKHKLFTKAAKCLIMWYFTLTSINNFQFLPFLDGFRVLVKSKMVAPPSWMTSQAPSSTPAHNITGREICIGKTVPEVLSTAQGRRPRAVLKTEGTVFPYTDWPRPVNNVFIFFCNFGGGTRRIGLRTVCK